MNPTEAATILTKALLDGGSISAGNYPNAETPADMVAEVYKTLYKAIRYPLEREVVD